jgi:hypothetical protein
MEHNTTDPALSGVWETWDRTGKLVSSKDLT